MSSDPSSAPYERVPSLFGLNIHNIIAGLANHTDREAALVGHALVDAALEAAISNRFIAEPDSRLFKPPGGPLVSCGAKTMVAKSLGLLHPILHCDINHLTNIRNRFAHSVNPLEFSTPWTRPKKGEAEETSEWIRLLEMPTHYLDVFKWTDTLCSDGNEPREDEDGENAYYIVDAFGAVGAQYVEGEFSLDTLKGKFLASIKLCCMALAKIAIQTNIKPHQGRRTTWL